MLVRFIGTAFPRSMSFTLIEGETVIRAIEWEVYLFDNVGYSPVSCPHEYTPSGHVILKGREVTVSQLSSAHSVGTDNSQQKHNSVGEDILGDVVAPVPRPRGQDDKSTRQRKKQMLAQSAD